jgi:Tol biopolymer transport system component
MVAPLESLSFISPDGGYVIFVTKLGDGKESLFVMDSSGAAKPAGEPAESIRAYGWLPDSRHFVYTRENQEQTRLLIGDIKGGPPSEMAIKKYDIIRWLDEVTYLARQDKDLYLGDINGGELLIAEDVSDFDFGK